MLDPGLQGNIIFFLILSVQNPSSGPSLFVNRIIRYYRMYELRAKAQMILCACAG